MRNFAADGTSKRVLRGALLTAIALLPEAALARSPGIDSSQMFDGIVSCGGGVTGIACHGPASSEVFVTITGPDSLTSDETAIYAIEIFESVQGSGALQAGAGLNVVAIVDQVLTDIADGILDENNPNTQITDGSALAPASGQITHVNARSPLADGSLGVASYDFEVTAPSDASTLELRAAMNAFNNNLLPTGDNWNSTSLFVTVPEPGAGALAATALFTLVRLRRLSTC